MDNVRVRFAPSPTGKLHIGGVRTALFNYLFAKQNKGQFILRIEDTDKERSKEEYEENIYEALKWLGLDWDELYRQSNREDLYKKYIEELLETNKAYRCFCSKEDLEAQRQYFMSIGKPPVYDGTCRDLSSEEVQEKLDRGEKYIIRFRAPASDVGFEDIIRDKVVFGGDDIGDFSIARSLTEPLYNMACVIDDHDMKITHVIRGEDHISNTPRQILIYRAFGWNPPQFAHLPLILAPDKSKLSKRHGAGATTDYKEQGYLPEAIVNFLAFLGWNPGTEKEMYSLEELIKDFSLDRVRSSGSIFDLERLEYINGSYIRQKDISELTDLCLPYLEVEDKTRSELEYIVSLYQERMKKLSEIGELAGFFFEDQIEYDKGLLAWKDQDESEIKLALDKTYSILSEIKEDEWTEDNISEPLLEEAKNFGQELRGKSNRGYLLWPMRVALTGQKASAGPFEVAAVLGRERTLKRIKEAL